MATQTDYDGLLAGLDACRWDQMRVLADAYDERGDTATAAGWRWLADKGRWPVETAFNGQAGCWTMSDGWAAADAMFDHPSAWEERSPACRYLPPSVVQGMKSLFSRSDARTTVWLTLAALAVGEWLAERGD
jgi:hypothetical protein